MGKFCLFKFLWKKSFCEFPFDHCTRYYWEFTVTSQWNVINFLTVKRLNINLKFLPLQFFFSYYFVKCLLLFTFSRFTVCIYREKCICLSFTLVGYISQPNKNWWLNLKIVGQRKKFSERISSRKWKINLRLKFPL